MIVAACVRCVGLFTVVVLLFTIVFTDRLFLCDEELMSTLPILYATSYIGNAPKRQKLDKIKIKLSIFS